MKMNLQIFVALLAYCFLGLSASGQPRTLFASTPLKEEGDLSSLMVEGIDHFLTIETQRIKQARNGLWQFNFSDPEVFVKSITSQRDILAKRLGVVDVRVSPDLEVLTSDHLRQLIVETDACIISAVRWSVLEGLSAEGLLLQPRGKVIARAVMIPDADILPEVLAGMQNKSGKGYGVARQLAESGWEIIIPVLINREDTFSGSELVGRYTNQPHREWIYRQSYEVGRHIIGYELQKIFSAVDWLESRSKNEGGNILIGVAGYGEGGMLALEAAALDPRISSTLVSGYFDAREQLWSEPIYRNVFGLLKYCGDAELAVMSWPRCLVLEHSLAPEVTGPPIAVKGRAGAAPGLLITPGFSTAEAEYNRARSLLPAARNHIQWYHGTGGSPLKPFSAGTLGSFARGLNVNLTGKYPATLYLPEEYEWLDVNQRQERTVRDMERHVQRVLDLCERTRDKDFWQMLKGDTSAQRPVKMDKRELLRDVIGRLPTPTMPANPRSRLLQKTENWTSYEIMLDVWPGVFAWGILLIPDDLKPGEKRPVIVCQHGLEGLPVDVITTDPNANSFRPYQGFASRLADRGYIVFAPHNPYRGGDKFRVLQRKANPLGLSLFSVIVGQHQRIVEWLGQQSFIDQERIGFYGLSYGGKAAMRIPALVEDYAISICSGDFNEWVRKNASTDFGFSYMFTGEYEIFEWDLGHTFNYAEMAGLIAPRPFMVERGHNDGVGIDEWVAYEFAKVNRHYDFLGLPESCRIEYFNGPHMIHGIGTFEFIDRHLKYH